jgi:hypothetical protein
MVGGMNYKSETCLRNMLGVKYRGWWVWPCIFLYISFIDAFKVSKGAYFIHSAFFYRRNLLELCPARSLHICVPKLTMWLIIVFIMYEYMTFFQAASKIRKLASSIIYFIIFGFKIVAGSFFCFLSRRGGVICFLRKRSLFVNKCQLKNVFPNFD